MGAAVWTNRPHALIVAYSKLPTLSVYEKSLLTQFRAIRGIECSCFVCIQWVPDAPRWEPLDSRPETGTTLASLFGGRTESVTFLLQCLP